MTDDIDLSESPRRRSRLDSCPDGMCGGCPMCLDAQGLTDEPEPESEDE